MSSKKEEDNFDTIVNSLKTLKPIKFKFSNQSIKCDKYFKNLNIESLEKKLHQKGKPPPTFHDTILYKHINKTYNLNEECYEYFEDMNGEKKMPIKIEKKTPEINKNFSIPEFERKIDELLLPKKEEEKKYTYRNENKFFKGIKRPFLGSDPGYYHPNYKIIEKRSPCFDFGKAIRNSDLNKEKNDKIDINKDKPEEKEKMVEENSKTELKDNKNNFNNYKINKTNMNNQMIKFNLNNINKNKTLNKVISRNPKFNETNNKTHNSILPKINLKKDINTEKKSIFKKMNLKKNMKKVFSTPNIISFQKMRGRDSLNDSMIKKSRDVFYEPNYNCIKPHIKGFIFKATEITKDDKKNKVGKMIRIYRCDPYKYIILDINENKISNKNPKNENDLKLYQYYQNKTYKK